MLSATQSNQISQVFKVIGDSFRIRLLLALADQEACVCHLECQLGKRQAYISQHLMSLREAGLLTARREGKYIFYQLKDRSLTNLIRQAAQFIGISDIKRKAATQLSKCVCPHCASQKLVSIE
jgi:DNA-binding transcriptional ArsR family regulator